MIKNNLKATLRNIRHHKGYSFINIFGLAVGMACCILILLWVQDELSYDRFHEHRDRIYRVALGDPGLGPGKSAAVTPIPLAVAAREEIPEVIQATRLRTRSTLLQYGEKRFDENGLMVSPDFLRMFSFRLIHGDIETALDDPFSIVITESLAEKYFGDEEPLSKSFRENNMANFTVTGVIEDVPSQSHLQFDFLMAFKLLERMRVDLNNWDDISYYSYVQLDEKGNVASVQDKLNDRLKSKIVISGFVGIAFLTGFISGSYPALYLSSFRPVAVLKGSAMSTRGNAYLRKILVVVQFALTIMVLIGMTLVHGQLRYLNEKELGYDKNYILTFWMNV